MTGAPALRRGHPGGQSSTGRRAPRLSPKNLGQQKVHNLLLSVGSDCTAPPGSARLIHSERTLPRPGPAHTARLARENRYSQAQYQESLFTSTADSLQLETLAVQTPSYANNVDTEKPGPLENPNRDLIGVKQRSEQWRSSESPCQRSHPGCSSGWSPVTMC